MSEKQDPKPYEPKRPYTDKPAKSRPLFQKAADSKPQARKMTPPPPASPAGPSKT